MKFGFVGLGQMGAPMAMNLARAYDVTIFSVINLFVLISFI